MIRDRKWLFPILAVSMVFLVGYTIIFQSVFTSRLPGANDFFSRWAGTRLYFTQGWDPYGVQTGRWIQNAIWGHPARPGEDPSLFAYPFYTIFLIAPYALISDYSWAQAAWQVTLQVAVVATLALLLVYHHWRPSPLMFGVLVVWMVFFYPTARSIILGQLGVIVFGMTVIAAWLLFRKQGAVTVTDHAVGVLLAVTTVKPQMQFLVIPFMLLWAWRERRWHVLGSFFLAMIVLVGISFVLLPTWFVEWIDQVINYLSYTPPAVMYILSHEVINFAALADALQWILDAVLAGFLLYVWWQTIWKRNVSLLDWAFGMTLVITHLIAPRTATTHFIVFAFALIPFFRDWSAVRRWGFIVTVSVMLALDVGMGWLFFATVVGRQESDLMHLPLPIIMFVLLLIWRPQSKAPAHGFAAS